MSTQTSEELEKARNLAEIITQNDSLYIKTEKTDSSPEVVSKKKKKRNKKKKKTQSLLLDPEEEKDLTEEEKKAYELEINALKKSYKQSKESVSKPNLSSEWILRLQKSLSVPLPEFDSFISSQVVV